MVRNAFGHTCSVYNSESTLFIQLGFARMIPEALLFLTVKLATTPKASTLLSNLLLGLALDYVIYRKLLVTPPRM